ncbi:disulfide bond formation protein B [Albibacillus kandeliae]|uniref:disulfide bond formation protein B n=1 Tax=Albibacillus kandeliae TaxID=2174228 RepID=UPI000D69172D|nr:disulfide bond formation protein B [Albibacillus kandeliae]
MTRKTLSLIAAAGSAAMLLGAFAFQYIGGLAPCHLCLLQRWPHAAAILIGLLALVFPGAALPLLGALAALTTAGIGAYHTGVERGWWEGPTTCTSSSVGGLSSDQLFDQIMNAPMIRCDEVAWSMMGLSMASWNMIASLVLAAIWIAAARRA